jgi:RHS repeat-associated protein
MPDALGSVRQIADASGNIIRTQDYKPYGSALNSNGSGQSTYGFTGEERDQSGLIFLRARYMQPELGIFLSRDPWPGDQLRSGSMNGYSYIEGNPVLLTDPSGKCPMCWIIIAILAAACSSDSSSQQPTTTPDQILGSTVGLAVVSSENGSPSYEPAIATFLQNGQLFTHDHFKKVDPSKADKVYIYSPKGGNPIAIVNGSDIQQMPGVVHDAYGFYSLTTVNLAAKGVIGANLVDAQNLRIGDQVMAPRWMDSDLTHGLAVFPGKVKEIDREGRGIPPFTRVEIDTSEGDSGSGLWLSGSVIGSLRSEGQEGVSWFSLYSTGGR